MAAVLWDPDEVSIVGIWEQQGREPSHDGEPYFRWPVGQIGQRVDDEKQHTDQHEKGEVADDVVGSALSQREQVDGIKHPFHDGVEFVVGLLDPLLDVVRLSDGGHMPQPNKRVVWHFLILWRLLVWELLLALPIWEFLIDFSHHLIQLLIFLQLEGYFVGKDELGQIMEDLLVGRVGFDAEDDLLNFLQLWLHVELI